ncbi:MAG: Glu-tRNA(Gln) amidotransferase GatDE subunit E [Thermoprotei archaeon]|nr:MAG: Glu-tRNA(Gln) amidotransferase GatDE subunit E [Thermoprotei archaeon]
MNYAELGLKVGLELHQQLDTKHKLFCSCPTRLRDDEPDVTFLRRLRPTQSELGQVDEAALFEFRRGRRYLYESYNDSVCLVEEDEEPPHEVNQEAIDIALEVALMLKATPVDQVCVMRKVVIDGSNTTGFQRTLLVALGGPESVIEDEEGPVHIETICVEEDAARKIREDEGVVNYRLDRLGIPLIEIATAPEIRSPEQARRVALKIGMLLRATGKVKRGLGTIRQDLNISIERGARVEIKGVQDLDLLPKIIEYEVQRQLNLLKIAEELKRRGVKPSDLNYEFIDVTRTFSGTKSKVIADGIKRGWKVLAVKLAGFAGLIGLELQPGRRFGTELKDYAVFWGGVKGIFHTDELPGYGITKDEVEALRSALNAGPQDAVVFTVAPYDKAYEALKAVVDRAKQAIVGVPEETRSANPDGTTKYSRPRPGAARMYPETDVRPLTITPERIERIKSSLPELPEHKLKRFIEVYGLSPSLAEAILRSRRLRLFEEAVSKTKVPPIVIASVLEVTLKSLKKEGVDVDKLRDEDILEVFKALEAGRMSKEAVPEVLKWLADHPGCGIAEALSSLGVRALTMEELQRIVREVIEENIDLIKRRGRGAINPLIGEVMKRVKRGADGKLVSELVLKEVAAKYPDLL